VFISIILFAAPSYSIRCFFNSGKVDFCPFGLDYCLGYLNPATGVYDQGCTSSSLCGNYSSLDNNSNCCGTDYCNSFPGVKVKKDDYEMSLVKARMRSIMYPVLGMIFGVLWLLAAVFLPTFPSGWLLLIMGFLDAFFGLFLIFVPQTTYLGLYFVALGAFLIYISHHDGYHHDHWAAALFAVIGFLEISGLTFIPFNNAPWFDQVTPQRCWTDLGYDIAPPYGYYGYPTRCENYLLFVLFCIYMLFLLQPFTFMLTWYSTRASVVVAPHAGVAPATTVVHKDV